MQLVRLKLKFDLYRFYSKLEQHYPSILDEMKLFPALRDLQSGIQRENLHADEESIGIISFDVENSPLQLLAGAVTGGTVG